MQDFKGKKILLGICGGIAAYKAAYLVRELKKQGAAVRVVMTHAAQEFITPLTLQALSGEEVRTELFDCHAEKAMGHIELARWADFLLIAPATANFIAKMAQGFADDLLSTLYLATTIPVILCPAMNKLMWNHPATVKNCQILSDRGVLVVSPEIGEQACGEYGEGRLAEITTIINRLKFLELNGLLKGIKVLITAGPTIEAIDPVRFLSNHSSGLMGYALAEAALAAGAEVHLVSGPVALQASAGIKTYAVQSAQQMHDKVFALLQADAVFIGCAAVADYRPLDRAGQKIKKSSRPFSIELQLNPDILADVAKAAKAKYVVGFAAETENLIENAQQKLKQKKVDMIIANPVGDGIGFSQKESQATIITSNEQIVLPLASKMDLAGKIIAILAATLQNESHLPRRI